MKAAREPRTPISGRPDLATDEVAAGQRAVFAACAEKLGARQRKDDRGRWKDAPDGVIRVPLTGDCAAGRRAGTRRKPMQESRLRLERCCEFYGLSTAILSSPILPNSARFTNRNPRFFVRRAENFVERSSLGPERRSERDLKATPQPRPLSLKGKGVERKDGRTDFFCLHPKKLGCGSRKTPRFSGCLRTFFAWTPKNDPLFSAPKKAKKVSEGG